MNWSIEKAMQDKPVVIADLQRLLAEGDRLVVRDLSGNASILFENAPILFESTDKKDLDELWESLTLETPVGWRHCMCIGDPLLHVYRAEQRLVSLTNHHGSSIRCSLWSSDVRVLDTEKWLSWFDRRGIAAPRREVEDSRALEAQERKDYHRWLSAMPRAVREIWSLPLNPFDRVDVIPLGSALETEMPEERDRILSLLEWFGCGAGPWSGFPVYELAAEELLLDYSTTSLVAALESMALTPAQKEGAARLFAGWHFAKQRPAALNCLPDSLKQMLWDHILETQQHTAELAFHRDEPLLRRTEDDRVVAVPKVSIPIQRPAGLQGQSADRGAAEEYTPDGDKLSRATRAFDTGVNRLKKREL